uniref:Uncharacterized protein n=1 Tax=Arundo donax TaxID=35708 RepID=A0A0A8YPG4_ARUDO
MVFLFTRSLCHLLRRSTRLKINHY